MRLLPVVLTMETSVLFDHVFVETSAADLSPGVSQKKNTPKYAFRYIGACTIVHWTVYRCGELQRAYAVIAQDMHAGKMMALLKSVKIAVRLHHQVFNLDGHFGIKGGAADAQRKKKWEV